MSFSKIISIIITLIIILASKGIFKNRKSSSSRLNRLDREEMEESNPLHKATEGARSSEFNEAHNLWKQGSSREALVVLNRSGKSDLNTCILLAEVYYDLRDYDAAIMAYKKSLRVTGTSFAYTRLGEIYEAMELYSEGIKAYKTALRYPEAQKGYLYHKLGNLYMYAGNEAKSEKYTEKAETYHSNGIGTRIQPFDFSKNTTSKSRRQTPFILIIILVIMLMAGAFIPFVINDRSTTIDTYEVVIEEGVLLDQEDIISESIEEGAILEKKFGNTNSNINYGGHITEYDGHTYLFEGNGIHKVNEDAGTMELLVKTSAVAYINVLKDKLFYVHYDGDDATVNYQSMNTNYSVVYSSEEPWNLLVDDKYMYFIEGVDSRILRVESHMSDESYLFPLKEVYFINQTQDALFLLQDGTIYKVMKNELKSNLNLISNDHIFYEGNIIFIAIEDNIIFFIEENDRNLYRMSADDGIPSIVLEDFDIDRMTLNAYKQELFIGIEGDEVYTEIYDFYGVYRGSVEGTVGNQLSNDYLYWYVE